MGFVKSFDEIMANTRATVDFYDTEMLMVFWETKPEIVAKLLPPPLMINRAKAVNLLLMRDSRDRD
jgi:hypothetical protein